MNIMFTADIHANKKRLPDVLQFLDFCIDTIEKDNIDLFVIGGDLWNAMIPNTKGSGFVDIMSKLVTINHLTKLRIIYGTPSHEPEGSLDFVNSFDNSTVYRSGYLESFADGPKILFIPEPRRADFISEDPKETSKKINKYLTDLCEQNADIIFYHGELDGAVMDNGMPCKADYRLSKTMFDKSCAQLLLAGHIHTPQNPFKNAYYVGSPIPCNFGERHEGSIIEFKFENGTIRDLHRIKTNAPVYKCFELESLDELNGLFNIKLKNSHVKVSIPLTASEKLSLNINKTIKELREKTEANSVQLKVFVDNEVSIRSKEIVKAVSIQDKLKIYAAVNEFKISDSILEKAKILEDNLLINYTFPSHSFELISLDLRGAKGLKGREEIFIDFSKFEDGLVALIGGNGCGKTTLLEMASPFPFLLTRTGTLRSHFYLKDSHKIVVFKDETGKYYRFTIQLAAHVDTGLVKYFAETSDDNETWKSVKECTGNLTDYQNYVESLFGDISLYLRTAFFTKGNTKGTPDIATATKGERITLLSQLLGTDSLSTLHTMTNDKIKEIKEKINSVSDIEAEYDELANSLPEMHTKERIVLKDLANVDSQLDLLQEKLPDIRQKAAEFNEKYAGKSNPVDLKAECQKRVDDLTKHLKDLKHHKEMNDFYKLHKEEIQDYAECAKRYETIQSKVSTSAKKVKDLSEKYYECKFDLDTTNSRLNNESQKIVNTKEKIKTLQSSLPEISDYCPTCGAKLSESKKKRLFAEQEKINDEINTIKDFIIKQEEIIRKCKKDLTAAKAAASKAEDKMRAAKEEFNELDGQSVATNVYLEMHSDLKPYVSYLEVSNLNADIEKVSTQLKRENDMLISIDTQDYVDYNIELAKLEAQKKSADELKLKFSMDYAALKKEIDLTEKQLESLKDEKQQAQELALEYDDYVFLEKAFSNSGIQALELESAAPSIAELTNQILKESYGDKFTVSFSTLKQGRTKLVDDFSINVTNNESGWTTPIELLSEGEKIWVIQSLYYAFSLIRMEKTGFSFKVRFVDESDGALDSEMRLKYVSMIESAHKAGNARLTIMITHSQEVKDIVSQVINL